MTLLEDINSYLKDADLDRLDMDSLAETTKSVIEENQIFIERRRWGITYGNVFARYNTTRSPTFEYVMVTEYEYDEGADGGDPEIDAYNVLPRMVSTQVWDAVKA